VGETKNLARQRLSHFLAARLEARKREANEAQRAADCSDATVRSRSDSNSAGIADNVGSTSGVRPDH
jgi:hypothetical protein